MWQTLNLSLYSSSAYRPSLFLGALGKDFVLGPECFLQVNDVQADLGSTPAPACGFCPGDATQHQRRYIAQHLWQ